MDCAIVAWDEFSIPTVDEIKGALPLSQVLSPDVVLEAGVSAATLLGSAQDDRLLS